MAAEPEAGSHAADDESTPTEPIETVTPDVILQQAKVGKVAPEMILQRAKEKRGGAAVSLTPEQRAGMGLAVGVGALAAVMFVFAAFDWVRNTPRPPTVPTDAQSAQTAIANYKSLADTAHEGTLRWFDATVTKVLYPVFTAIVGYIFGSRTKAGDSG